MKKKQNETKLKQKLTKFEWMLLGVTALFLIFAFRGREPSGVTVSALPSGGVSGADENPDVRPESDPEAVENPETGNADANPGENPDDDPGENPESPDINQDINQLENMENIGNPEERWKININTATAGELEDLPGIGPALAERIIEYRTEHGNFQRPEDLTDVSGIGPGKFAALADLITV